ncbi:Ankyrin repeat and protein kinase domain-containing protein 1 [Phytophthora nicotianae]|uniref:Ankyrin repeat and protein kinase domain-containing protein 1 n=1 Tax=Phytophthora nicotianae TaxID=4792 RepID=A0A0W8CPD6_PHYNI|nr:Ankyrin repeat and protein kinase domain-containing protein 1 [Phytophthora nicotianae]
MADSLYLSKSDYRLGYISGITMGQASPLSALVTDANRNIADIGELSCTSLKLNGSTVNLSKLDLLSATPGTASSGKALITDGSNNLTDLSSLIIRGSNSSKALIIQNDTAASSASLNIVSFYQMGRASEDQQMQAPLTAISGVFANSDRLLMDSSGNMSIGGAVNTLYKLDISGALNATSLYVNGSAADLSKLSLLSAVPGTASASKALITDSLNNLTDLYTLTIKGSNTNKSLIIQNDTTSSSASLNIVSFYQMEQGVRGSANASNPNCYFWRFANSDRLLMDSSGNIAIGGSINTSL